MAVTANTISDKIDYVATGVVMGRGDNAQGRRPSDLLMRKQGVRGTTFSITGATEQGRVLQPALAGPLTDLGLVSISGTKKQFSVNRYAWGVFSPMEDSQDLSNVITNAGSHGTAHWSVARQIVSLRAEHDYAACISNPAFYKADHVIELDGSNSWLGNPLTATPIQDLRHIRQKISTMTGVSTDMLLIVFSSVTAQDAFLGTEEAKSLFGANQTARASNDEIASAIGVGRVEVAGSTFFREHEDGDEIQLYPDFVGVVVDPEKVGKGSPSNIDVYARGEPECWVDFSYLMDGVAFKQFFDNNRGTDVFPWYQWRVPVQVSPEAGGLVTGVSIGGPATLMSPDERRMRGILATLRTMEAAPRSSMVHDPMMENADDIKAVKESIESLVGHMEKERQVTTEEKQKTEGSQKKRK